MDEGLKIYVLFLVGIAVWSDYKYYRISNRIIVVGSGAGMAYSCFRAGIAGAVNSTIGFLFPILLLWILFAIKVFGGGDIKLFAMIGSFGYHDMTFNCILWSFAVGGVIALAKMLLQKDLVARLKCLGQYCIKDFSEYVSGRKDEISIYKSLSTEKNKNVIHFSIAILIGFVMEFLFFN